MALMAALALLTVAMGPAGSAPAAVKVKCGQVIKHSVVLAADVGPCPGTGVIVGKDGITLDLNGKRIFGTPGPGDGNHGGIRLPRRFGVTIKNGTVSDFDAGVVIMGGGNNRVTEMEVRDNLGPEDNTGDPLGNPIAFLGDGIVLFFSANNVIELNTVVGNGVFDGIGILGGGSDNNVVRHNLVADNRGPSTTWPFGQGIILNPFLGQPDGSVVSNNTVESNVITGNASAGITNFNHVDGKILSNTVENNGSTNQGGNGIGITMAFSSEGRSGLLVQDNQVHGNDLHGIDIREGASANRIINNDASNNAKSQKRYTRDLRDQNPNCDADLWSDAGTNVWFGNKWGTGLFDPPCTTTGGSGPLPTEGIGDSEPEPLVDIGKSVRSVPPPG